MAEGRSDIHYIVNLKSGGGRTQNRWPRLRAAIESRGLDGAYLLTGHPWHGFELASRAIEAGADTIVAIGGDGTLYEAANAILHADAAGRVRLGTIPMGTGKDVARCLDMPRPGNALRALADGHERWIDAGRAEAQDANGQPLVRFFLLEASAGWVPEISASVPRALKRLGDTAPYVLMTMVKMAGPMARDFIVYIDGEPYDGRYNTISIHNMEYWGGDLLVAPGAAPDDGVLDVLRWGDLGRGAVLKAVQGQRTGGAHLDIDGIDRHPARMVSVASGKRTQIDLDGEQAGYLPATFSVVPRALRFIAPAAGRKT